MSTYQSLTSMKGAVIAKVANPDFFSTQVIRARRFFLNLNPDARNDLTIVCGGVEQCAPNYITSRQSFPFYSIEFVARGLGKLRLGGHAHRLRPGIVFSYGPSIPHEISTDTQQRLTKYFVDFSGKDAVKILKESGLAAGSVAQIFPPMELHPLFDELIRSGLCASRRAPQVCALLLKALSQKIADSRAPLSGRQTLSFEKYQHCRDHISRDFQRLHSIQQVAEECHLDQAYLCRLFKRYDQETPYRYLLRLKMTFAAERLQSPAVLVKQVAEETGFANQFHFSRAFKTVFGISPRKLSRIR